MINISNPAGSKRLVNTHSEAKNLIKNYKNLSIEIIERFLDTHKKLVGQNPYDTGIKVVSFLRNDNFPEEYHYGEDFFL